MESVGTEPWGPKWLGVTGAGEGVAEVAAVAVRAVTTGGEHAAELGLVAGVSDHRPQLLDPVRELAALPVRAPPLIHPLVAQLRLRHPLAVGLHLHLPILLLSLNQSSPTIRNSENSCK